MQMAASRRSGEMADTLRSGRSTREGVGVRIPPSAPLCPRAQSPSGLGALLIWLDDNFDSQSLICLKPRPSYQPLIAAFLA